MTVKVLTGSYWTESENSENAFVTILLSFTLSLSFPVEQFRVC